MRGNCDMALDFDLAATRRDRGWSQANLARASHLSLRQIKKLEQGQVARPHPHTLQALRAALEVAPSDLSTLLDPQLAAIITKASSQGSSADDLLFAAMMEEFCRQIKAICPAAAYLLIGREATPAGFDSLVHAVLDEKGSTIVVEQEAIDEGTSEIEARFNEWCEFFDAHTEEWPDTHIDLKARSVIATEDIPDAGDHSLD
jgi:transcriptional regulator with XRE-family HTH domain